MKYPSYSVLCYMFCLVANLMFTGCGAPSEEQEEGNPYFEADEDQGGLSLAPGMQAYVIADDLGRARHVAVNERGDIYVKLREPHAQGGIVALRDTTGDGRADQIEYFSDFGGTGMAYYNGNLYASNDSTVFRYTFSSGNLLPDNAASPDTIVSGFVQETSHAAKSITIDDQGNLYVNVGAPSNACQETDRTKGSPAMDPCPLLELYGGVWRFDAERIGQTQQKDGHRFSTGIRNAVALEANPLDGHVYVVQHGRDMLTSLFPEMYDEQASAEIPAEEFFRLSDGADFGWPYCYYDPKQDKRVLSPEYGGDRQTVGRCENTESPIMTFPAHWGPNDILFNTGDHFPEQYSGGAFIAFHGSWNRAPLEQEGYLVTFVPFENGNPTGDFERFADGFAGVDKIESPGDAEHRPTGLAMAPDGTLIISDSVTGKLWRVFYREQEVLALK